MRYTSGVIVWKSGHLHPVETAIASCPSVSIETTYQISRFRERFVELSKFSGDMSRLESLLANEDSVFEFEVTRESGLVYLEYRQSPSMEELFDIISEYSLVVLPPIEYTDAPAGSGVRLTVAGTKDAIASVSTNIPNGIELYPERIGEYTPDEIGLEALLTERQKEVFKVAVELGYYDVPRKTTHREIANEVGRAPSTVSEQLQRIEANLLPRYLE